VENYQQSLHKSGRVQALLDPLGSSPPHKQKTPGKPDDGTTFF
jgi:hypothetical protein